MKELQYTLEDFLGAAESMLKELLHTEEKCMALCSRYWKKL